VLLFSPVGYVARLVCLHLLSSDHWAAEPFGVFVINMIASFVLGFVGGIPATEDNDWLWKGIATGFCGCASTFGTLITIASNAFITGVVHSCFPHLQIRSRSLYDCLIALSFLIVGTESSRASFD
ncbi:hypothetical protein WA577_007191, partial [Blastocystis sp. JDR]